MPIIFTCPCGQRYSVEDHFAGQQAPCHRCGRVLFIPNPAAAGPDLPEVEPVPSSAEGSSGGGVGGALTILLVILLFAGALAGGVLWMARRAEEQKEDSTDQVAEKQGKTSPRKDKKTVIANKDTKTSEATFLPRTKRKPSKLPPPSKQAWKGHLSPILTVAFGKSGNLVLTAAGGIVKKGGQPARAKDSSLRLWEASTGREGMRFEEFPGGLSAVAFSRDGNLAAVSDCGKIEDGKWVKGGDGAIILWDLVKDTKRRTLKGHVKDVRCLAFSPDGKQLLSGGDDFMLRLWDVRTGKMLKEMKGHDNSPTQIVFSPDGSQALTGCQDHIARLWDLEDGRLVRELTGHKDIVWTVAFTPDGKKALTAGGGQILDAIEGLDELAAGARDYEIRLWNLGSGKEIKRFAGHEEPVTALAVSSNGRRFVSTSRDKTLRLWQIDTGKEVAKAEEHAAPVRAVVFFPDGRRTLSAGEDGALNVWTLPLDLPDVLADLKGKNSTLRRDALRQLARLGEEGRVALPILFDLLSSDKTLRPHVLTLLQTWSPLGADHLSRLEKMLKDKTYLKGRSFALDEMIALKEKAKPSAAAILAATSDADASVRRRAFQALVFVVVGVRDKAFGPLLDGLRDDDSDIRASSEKGLAALGGPGVKHLPILRRYLSDKSEPVRRYALKAIGDLGDGAKDAAPDLCNRVKMESIVALRVLAVAALEQVDRDDKASIAVFTRALDDPEASVARRAITALAAVKPVSSVVPALLQALEHEDAEVSKAASKALDKVNFSKSHVPGLAKLLKSKREEVRSRGLAELMTLASDASPAIEAICALLAKAKAKEREKVLELIAKMGTGAKEAGPELVKLLKVGTREEKLAVCLVLAKTGSSEVKHAVPVLLPGLKAQSVEELTDKDATGGRKKVRDALASIGEKAVEPLRLAVLQTFNISKLDDATEAELKIHARIEVLKTLMAIDKAKGNNRVMLLLSSIRANKYEDRRVRAAALEAYTALQKKE